MPYSNLEAQLFLSIIVPVYNSENYILECLRSIQMQDFRDYEILLIDDCSSDNTPALCSEQSKKDNRIKYIRREKNGGTSAARNTGIRMAQGEYITFTDNDDFWRIPNALSSLHKLVCDSGNPDVVVYPTCSYWQKRNELEVQSNKSINQSEINGLSLFDTASTLLSTGLYCSAVWSKLISRDLILKNSLFFPEGRRNEDCEWSLKLLYHLKSLKYFDCPFYVWRRNSEVSQSAKPLRIDVVNDLAWVLSQHNDNVRSQPIQETNKSLANKFASYLFVVFLGYIGVLDDCDTSSMFQVAQKTRWLLRDGERWEIKICRVFVALFGLKAASFFLGLLMKRERKRITS